MTRPTPRPARDLPVAPVHHTTHAPHARAARRDRWIARLPFFTLAASLCALAPLALRALHARADVRSTRAAHTLLVARTLELGTLRAARSPVALGKRPQPGVVTQVSDALVRAGVPVAALNSLAPDADQSLPLPPLAAAIAPNAPALRYAVQSVRLSFSFPDLASLGGFLREWTTHHPEWTASMIQVTPLPAGDAQPTKPIVRADITLRATYLDSPAATTSAAAPTYR